MTSIMARHSRHGPDKALAEDDGELGLGHGPLTWRHFPLFFRPVQDQIEQLCGGIVAGEMPPGTDGAPELRVQSFDGVRNRYEEGGAEVPAATRRCGVWCDHPGQRHREHECAGRPMYSMSFELELVAGRLCDSPGCAESANP